ncbi:MAG: aquaporin [Gemmatimonadales bacterium]
MSEPASPRRAIVAEGVGTFLLVAIGPGAAMVAAKTGAVTHLGVALAFGAIVTIVVASTGHLSGAHINPAVTLGFWSIRRFPARLVPGYLTAQCVGAALAAFGLRWILGPVGKLGATIPALSLERSFAVEAVCSALLGFVIAAVATDERVPAGIAAMAIGTTVFAGALVAGPLTGGSFNPARSLGPALAGGGWTAHWLYWVAPIGGVTGGMQLYGRLGRRPGSPVSAGVATGGP